MLDVQLWAPANAADLGLLRAHLEGSDVVYHGFPSYYRSRPSAKVEAPWFLKTVRGMDEIAAIEAINQELGGSARMSHLADDGWLAVVLVHEEKGVAAYEVSYSWPLDPRIAWLERFWITPAMRSGRADYALFATLHLHFFWELARNGYVGVAALLPWTAPHWRHFMRSGPFRRARDVLRDHGFA
jgi:hypothetical protein